MNLFAQQIKFEDTEGLNLPEGQLITEGDEGESVAAAVAEVDMPRRVRGRGVGRGKPIVTARGILKH